MALIRVWLAPRDVCALMATGAARAQVAAALRRSLGLAGGAEAMALFQQLYARTYERCVAGQDPEALDEHRLVEVPRRVYRLLRALGFCTFRDAEGAARPLHDAEGHPVCLLGSFARKVANRASLAGNAVHRQVLQAVASQVHGQTTRAQVAAQRSDGALPSVLQANLEAPGVPRSLLQAQEAQLRRAKEAAAAKVDRRLQRSQAVDARLVANEERERQVRAQMHKDRQEEAHRRRQAELKRLLDKAYADLRGRAAKEWYDAAAARLATACQPSSGSAAACHELLRFTYTPPAALAAELNEKLEAPPPP
jgi:hypothetical protein